MDQQLAESAAPNADLSHSFSYSSSPIRTQLPVVIKPNATPDEEESQERIKDTEIEESSSYVKPDRNQSAVRDSLVDTAVSFLRNPKTSNASTADKKSFLLKKGLTIEEIDRAFFISGHSEENLLFDGNSLKIRGSQDCSDNQQSSMMRQSRSSATSVALMLSQFSFAISLLGGLAWGLYHMIRNYLVPLFQTSRQLEKRLRKQDTALHQISLTLEAINLQLSSNAAAAGNQTADSGRVRSQDLKDILEELRSMKRMMLSKDNFPPPPKIEPLPQNWRVSFRANSSEANSHDVGTNVNRIANGTEVSKRGDGSIGAGLDETPGLTNGHNYDEGDPKINGHSETENGFHQEDEPYNSKEKAEVD